MRYELKTIGLWSLLKVSFFLNLVFGFVVGLVYAFMFSVMIAISGFIPLEDLGVDTSELSLGFLFVGLPIVFSIGSAVFSTLICVFGAVVYNLIARLIGGLEFDLTPVNQTASIQPVSRPIMAQTAAPSQGPPMTATPPPQQTGENPSTDDNDENPPGYQG